MKHLQTFNQLLEASLQEAAKEKTYLVKLGRKLDDQVLDAWTSSAESLVNVVSVEKYNDDTVKVVFVGKPTDLKQAWQTQKVQDFAKLVGKDHVADTTDITYKNIRKG